MTPTSNKSIPAPQGDTQPPAAFDNCWIMYYRQGLNVQTPIFFHFKGDLVTARARAEKFCQTMGYKLYFVRPMITNLLEEELDHVDPQRHRRKLVDKNHPDFKTVENGTATVSK